MKRQARLADGFARMIRLSLSLLVSSALLAQAHATRADNSAAAHWAVQNVPPGQRGGIISQAAHGTLVIPTSTPTATATAPATSTSTPSATATSTPTNTPDPRCAGKSDGQTCSKGSDYEATTLCESGGCQTCVPDDSASPRFVDNGDGTISDRATCLVWEKKDDSGSIHDEHNTYDWSTCTTDSSSCSPDGSAFTTFLATLNSGSGFAGHRDWHLPSAGCFEEGLTGEVSQIETIQDVSVGFCATNSVTDGPCVYRPAFYTNCDYPAGNPGCTIDGSAATAECSCTATGTAYYSSTRGFNGTIYYPLAFNYAGNTCSLLWGYHDGLARAVRGGATGNCVPTTCSAQGATCGSIPDGCNGMYGSGGTLDCGSCSVHDTCGGGGVANQCGCTPTDTQTLCSNALQICGTRVNNCGQEVSCGTCSDLNKPKCCFETCVCADCACP